MAFSENNLKEAVGAIIAKASGGNGKLAASDVTLEYGKLLPDFKAGTLDIKVHGISKAGVGFDPDSFKKDILGKTNEQFEAYLSSYPDIEKAEVTYWPPFVSSKIPSYAKRVDIILDTK